MDHRRETLDAVKVQLTPADRREIETALSRGVVIGDLSTATDTRNVAGQVNALGWTPRV